MVAKVYARYGLDHDELVKEGQRTLLSTARHFYPEVENHTFETKLVWRLRYVFDNKLKVMRKGGDK